MPGDSFPSPPFKIKGPNWWDLWTVYAVDRNPSTGFTTVHLKKPKCAPGGGPILRTMTADELDDLVSSGQWSIRDAA